MIQAIMFLYQHDSEFFIKLTLFIIMMLSIIVAVMNVTGFADYIRFSIMSHSAIKSIKKLRKLSEVSKDQEERFAAEYEKHHKVSFLGNKEDFIGTVIICDDEAKVSYSIDRYNTISGKNVLSLLKFGTKPIDIGNWLFIINNKDLKDM